MNPGEKSKSLHADNAYHQSSNRSLSDISGNDSFHSCGSDSFYSYSEEDDVENFSDENIASTSGRSRFLESGISSGSRSHNPDQRDRSTSLVTSTFRYDRQKPENLFPPTKKYRYYPVTCDYCGKRFQPNKLKTHQRKYHSIGVEEVKPAKIVQPTAVKMGHKTKKSTTRSKSVGGIPRALQVCYICGRLYGSKSIKIHEPKCLDKWRIQNEQFPPELRAPELVKPEPELMVASNKEGYDIPSFDPAAEAAFRSHLATLIPCTHCSRTFSPDRIQKHMSCCIERPRTRDCITPVGGEIPR